MKKKNLFESIFKALLPTAYAFLLSMIFTLSLNAEILSGEQLYRKLQNVSRDSGDITLFEKLNRESRSLDWAEAEETEFDGNLRLLRSDKIKEKEDLFLIRNISGEIYILSIPEEEHVYYSNLDDMLQDKLTFKIKTVQGKINGETYLFAKLTDKPVQAFLDRIFKISIVLMLFFVMIGMGLTLAIKDFALIFKQPKGIIFGTVLQFGLMPFVAVGIGRLLGFYESYPFIFVGMILVTSTPGGATSNLMTYFAKGDLALSISLTSFSTVLSLVFTPLLLTLYCSNVPDVNMPVKIIVVTILFLVLLPLIIGMSIKYKWEKFAEKATPFFSTLGIIALLFIIIAGVISNLHVFADTARHGVKFYSTVFSLTLLGMIFGIVLSKLAGINNYQTRAISIEIGIRNVSLSMVIALLIQDYMGDFHSSMFVTSGIFGLCMYIAGAILIQYYKKLLPVD